MLCASHLNDFIHINQISVKGKNRVVACLYLHKNGRVSIGKGNVSNGLECPPNFLRARYVHPHRNSG